MKYIIISVLVFACFISGCSGKEKELVELNRVDDKKYSEPVTGTVNAGNVSVNDISAEDTSDSQPIVVYVSGCVVNPGVYELDGGSRVFDAIKLAGGFSDDAYEKNLNLAKVITDEQMIYVPSVSEYEEYVNSSGDKGSFGLSDSAETGNSEALSESGKVNINTASVEQLTTIPGIGKSKAEKIISFREENGAFKAPEDIMQISGIKEGMFNKIKDYICVK